MQEIWKDIKGYEGLYQISNMGRVKRFKRKEEKNLNPCKDKRGYLRIDLYKKGNRKNITIHRLVAIHFIPNPENKPEVNHKHGIKTDNRATELEWVTTSENEKHAYDTGLKKQKNGEAHHNSKKVIQYDLLGNFIKEWDCAMDIERKLNIRENNICACCRGEQNTAYGYVWKYKDIA